MRIILPIALLGLLLGGCTGSRTMYDNNGLTIVQTGADPTALNGGYNVLVVEQDGISTIVAISATGTIAEQIAMPGATVAGNAVLRPDTTTVQEGDVTIHSSARSRSKSQANDVKKRVIRSQSP